jgi:hypothetical protein
LGDVEGPAVKRALALAMLAAAMSAPLAATEATEPAKKFVEAQYGVKKMTPILEQKIEAAGAKPVDVDRVLKIVRSQMPEFYIATASAVAPLMAPGQMSQVAEFAASQTGKRLALADLNWAEEVRDQAEVCLDDGAARLRAVAKDRARAIGMAAKLVLGDCTVMREAKKELRGAIKQEQLDRARIYVDAGGVGVETIQGLAAPAANAAAKALIAAKVAPASEQRALATAVLKAVAAESAYWKDAAALHYAAAFRQDDLKKLAMFVASDAGAEYLTAKPKIDAAVAASADAWFSESIQEALGGGASAAAGAAVSAGMPAIGLAPAPKIAVERRSQPALALKPAN